MKKRIIFTAIIILVFMAIGIQNHSNRPDILYNTQKEDAQFCTYFTEADHTLLENNVEISLDSEFILEVEATGEYKYVRGNLIQEVKVIKMIKGENKLNQNIENAYVIGSGTDQNIELNEAMVGYTFTGYINYMKKGNHYVVFAEQLKYSEDDNSNIILVNTELCGMHYLNISNNNSYAYNTYNVFDLYGNVRDSEFFANDKESLDIMMNVKKDILNKLNIKYVE